MSPSVLDGLNLSVYDIVLSFCQYTIITQTSLDLDLV